MSILFERNSGFMESNEQRMLAEATVSVAGAGGDGGALTIQLARMGVGSFKIADPDPFELENTNRQAVCKTSTIGINKAESIGEYILDINPNASVEIFSEGINTSNVAGFVSGSNLIIDETEFTMHELGVMLARESRERDIPTLTAMNIGFGALVTTFHPKGKTLESTLGLNENDSIEQIAINEVPLSKWTPYLPPYGDMKVFEKVASGEKSAPSIAPGVAVASAIGATQAFLNIIEGQGNNRPSPIYAPRAMVIDAMTGYSKIVKFGEFSHYKHLSRMVLNNVFKRNPKASY